MIGYKNSFLRGLLAIKGGSWTTLGLDDEDFNFGFLFLHLRNLKYLTVNITLGDLQVFPFGADLHSALDYLNHIDTFLEILCIMFSDVHNYDS